MTGRHAHAYDKARELATGRAEIHRRVAGWLPAHRADATS